MCGLIVVPKKVKGQETWCDSCKNCKYIEACQFPHCYRYMYQIIKKRVKRSWKSYCLIWFPFVSCFVCFVCIICIGNGSKVKHERYWMTWIISCSSVLQVPSVFVKEVSGWPLVNTWQLLSSCQHDYLTCQGSFVLLCVMSFIQTVASFWHLWLGLRDVFR